MIKNILDALPTQLNEEATRFLMSYGRRLSFNPGETLVREGEACRNIYIILEGRANVVKNDRSGHSNLIAVVSKGSIIGEMAVFIDMKRSATIVADSAMTVLQLSNDDFVKALQHFPSIPIRLLRSLSMKLQDVNDKYVTARHNHHMLYLGMRILNMIDQQVEPEDAMHLNLDAMAEHAGLLPVDLTNAMLDYHRLGLVSQLKLQHGREANFQPNTAKIRDFIERAAIED